MALLYVIEVQNKYGFMNQSGQIVIEPKFDVASGFSQGIARVGYFVKGEHPDDGTLTFYIDESSSVVLEPDVSQLQKELLGEIDDRHVTGWTFGDFHDGLAVATICYYDESSQKTTFRSGYINVSGQIVIPFIFGRCEDFAEGIGVVQLAGSARDLWGAIDMKGAWAIFPSRCCRLGAPKEGLLRCLKDLNNRRQHGFLDRQGSVCIPFAYDYVSSFSDSMCEVWANGTTNYVRSDGSLVFTRGFERGSNFDSGVAYIIRNNRLQLIDKTGMVLCEVMNDCTGVSVSEFDEGMAILATGGELCDTPGLFKYKDYLNACGDIAIPGKFKHAGPFRNGLAKVTTHDGETGYINRVGEFVWKTRNS